MKSFILWVCLLLVMMGFASLASAQSGNQPAPTSACQIENFAAEPVRVYEAPDLNAPVFSAIETGIIYEPEGFIRLGDETWLVVNEYDGYTGVLGFVSRRDVAVTAGCA